MPALPADTATVTSNSHNDVTITHPHGQTGKCTASHKNHARSEAIIDVTATKKELFIERVKVKESQAESTENQRNAKCISYLRLHFRGRR